MSKVFKKQGEVQLVNGGYLSDSENNPIHNEEFVQAQVRAHRLVSIANEMKGKTFVTKEATDIHALINEVDKKLNSTSVESFIKVPEVKKGKTTLALEKEALAFIESKDNASLAEKINGKLQEFKIVKEFEDFGLFFDKGIVKLEKIYSVEEITEAATTVYSVLD